jgi:cell division protein ZapE
VKISQVSLDAPQARIESKLDLLAVQLSHQTRISFFDRILNRPKTPPARGMYVHGEVGRGKTMLMDRFFEKVSGIPKQRVHFHAFMQDVHAMRNAFNGKDVIDHIVENVSRKARLLCLDEMQITDIADAMIIGRLFEALLARNVCFVTTSNVEPEALYKDGLNRQLFVPFIEKLRANLDVLKLDSPTDYRLGRINARDTFITPLGEDADEKLDAIWRDLTDGTQGQPHEIDVLGRNLHVPRTSHSCARFSFSELCENPLGPADYIAISRHFRTVFVEHIPILTVAQRNEAKRLVLMIDTFYDARTRLVASAAAEPEKLYPKGQHGFEFKRTVSRLKEMQSASWWIDGN